MKLPRSSLVWCVLIVCLTLLIFTYLTRKSLCEIRYRDGPVSYTHLDVYKRQIRDTAPGAMCDAVEINSGLVRYLRENFNGVRVQCGDFMEWQPVQYYSRVIMNPPFSHGQDIRHILRAFSLLRPGGVLVAVCLNGPRQEEKLLPFSDVREELPRGTFAYTDVPTMIIRLRA